MNTISRTPAGIIPLERWLTNASPFLKSADSKKIVDDALAKISAKADGAPIIDDAVISDDIKEKIILTDDLVPFGFLQGGVDVGKAVGRIKVLPFVNGEKMLTAGSHLPHLGTAWLLSKKLVMTNHHVANARSREHQGDKLPIANDEDMALQGQHAVIEWDYLDPNVAPVTESFSGILAWDTDLDYAILELAQESTRRPLALVNQDVNVASLADRVPVNIIQHPGGDVKKVGLRNNLILRTTDDEIHYFTDTRRGSSGSPVLNDRWQVVGLHKSARRVDGVEYQGKPTAYVNVGAKIRKIIEHAKNNFPDIDAALND